MEVVKILRGKILNQRKYASEVLKSFNMLKCHAAETPTEAKVTLACIYK